MKRWAALTVGFYAVILILLTAPVLTACMSKAHSTTPYESGFSFRDAMEAYTMWGFWVWLAVLALGQALLLFAPVGLAERRPTPRRPLFVPVLTTSFFLGNLCLAGLLAVLCAIFRDNAFELFARIGAVAEADAEHNPITSQIWAAVPTADAQFLFGIAVAMALFWLLWALVFYRFARSDDPEALVKRTTRWLLRGSILDLLVAVPSHVIVRHRNDCCASGGTFWGIATGVSVMLLCFGPGVFFLFAERFGRLKPRRPLTETEAIPAADAEAGE